MSLPAALFSFYFVDGIGFKKTIWLIATCLSTGLTMRLGTLLHDGSNNKSCHKNITMDADFIDWYCPAPNWNYYVALLGNVIISFGAGLKCGMPSKLSAQWFQPWEKDLANSIASLADTLGVMLACLLSPIIAKEPSDLKFVQIFFAIPAYVAAICTCFIRTEGYILNREEMSFKVGNMSVTIKIF